MFAATTLALALVSYRERFPLPDATFGRGWGVNIHFTDPKPGEIDQIADAGFRWLRMDLFWHQVEREEGRYEFAAPTLIYNEPGSGRVR